MNDEKIPHETSAAASHMMEEAVECIASALNLHPLPLD
jgi:hypothetical protein